MAKNNKADILLNALLTYPSVREVSEATGIAEPTIYMKLRDENFKVKYNEAKGQLLEKTIMYLSEKAQRAAAVFVSVMDDATNAPQVRVNAARSVLDYCIKLTEQTEILERIEILEKSQFNGQYKHN